jgi:antitoxin ParD1/3/4
VPTEPQIVTMNISLPQPLKRYVDDKVSSGIYSSASEFVREAIREKLQRDEQRYRAEQAMAKQSIAGVDSGKSIPFTPGYFKAKKRALFQRAAAKKKKIA